jgi:phage baseplate assembly protein W
MYSIAFPNIFKNGVKTELLKDSDATKNNLKLLLNSERYSLFGDPYYGTALKRMIFEQNSFLLQDIIIDEIYTSILTFMPQIKIERKDISIFTDDYSVHALIKCVNLIDYTVNLYDINLTEDADQ